MDMETHFLLLKVQNESDHLNLPRKNGKTRKQKDKNFALFFCLRQ